MTEDRKPFQFTIWRLLHATFWIGCTCGACAILASTNRSATAEWQAVAQMLVRSASLWLVVVGPFIAVGSLFGKAKRGAYFGILAAGSLISVLFFSILVLDLNIREIGVVVITLSTALGVILLWATVVQRRRK